MTVRLWALGDEGTHTLRYRQSSLMSLFGFHISLPWKPGNFMSTYWKQALGYAWASCNPVHARLGMGGRKRLFPTGGSAKGMPRKALTWLRSGTGRRTPRTRPMRVWTTRSASLWEKPAGIRRDRRRTGKMSKRMSVCMTDAEMSWVAEAAAVIPSPLSWRLRRFHLALQRREWDRRGGSERE